MILALSALAADPADNAADPADPADDIVGSDAPASDAAERVASAPVTADTPTATLQTTAPARTRATDRPFAIGSYAAVRGGTYTASGVGGRARWQPFRRAGLDLYLEASVVDWEGGFRHDYPNGFSVYTPLDVGPIRVRPYFGFCDVVSLVEPTQPGAPRADDVMLGAHVGVGTEYAFGKSWSVFADAQVDAYAGHDRSSGNWTGNVAEDLMPIVTGQVNVGVQLHVADFR